MARLPDSLTVSVVVDETYMLESTLKEARAACVAWSKMPWLIRYIFEWDMARPMNRLERKLDALEKARERAGIL